MVYHGRVKNGVLVLNDTVRLPEGAEVRVDILRNGESAPQGEGSGRTLYDRLKPVIGIIDDLPADGSQNIDHYLYGHPKQ